MIQAKQAAFQANQLAAKQAAQQARSEHHVNQQEPQYPCDHNSQQIGQNANQQAGRQIGQQENQQQPENTLGLVQDLKDMQINSETSPLQQNPSTPFPKDGPNEYFMEELRHLQEQQRILMAQNETLRQQVASQGLPSMSGNSIPSLADSWSTQSVLGGYPPHRYGVPVGNFNQLSESQQQQQQQHQQQQHQMHQQQQHFQVFSTVSSPPQQVHHIQPQMSQAHMPTRQSSISGSYVNHHDIDDSHQELVTTRSRRRLKGNLANDIARRDEGTADIIFQRAAMGSMSCNVEDP